MGESGEVMTYAELDAGANRLSQLLHAAGLRPGDHVALCLENHPRYFEVVWGCHYAGLVYTACSSRLTSSELAYIVNDCGAQVFITSRYKADQAAEIVPETPEVEVRLMLDGVIEGYQPYEDAVARQPAEPLPDRIAGTDMLYSSGTTGRPKGVKSEAPVDAARLGADIGGRRSRRCCSASTPTCVYLSPAPLYHAAPLRFSMAIHELGGTVVVDGALRPRAGAGPDRALPGHAQPVGADHVRADAEAAGRGARSATTCRSLRVAVHAAAPCPVRREAADDRVVGTDPPRVLRRHRGQRLRLLQQRDVAGPPGHGRARRSAASSTSWTRTARSCRRARRARSTSRAGATFEYHNDPEKTAASRHREGAGRRSATSATSTTTASSTSPTARRT